MKKVKILSASMILSISVNAQYGYKSLQDPEMYRYTFNIVASIFVVLAFMVFILSIIKLILEQRLKNKIVDKGVPESLASSILQKNIGESIHANIKWFALLTGLGAGLIIVNYTLPLGIHSLAIMSLSIALSFLGYFLYLKKCGN